jgi:hypothetical protein
LKVCFYVFSRNTALVIKTNEVTVKLVFVRWLRKHHLQERNTFSLLFSKPTTLDNPTEARTAPVSFGTVLRLQIACSRAEFSHVRYATLKCILERGRQKRNNVDLAETITIVKQFVCICYPFSPRRDFAGSGGDSKLYLGGE